MTASKGFPLNHDDDGPTEYEKQILVLDVAREEFRPLLEDYAAEYAASARAYQRALETPKQSGPAPTPPNYDSSHLDAIFQTILLRARTKVLGVLELDMRPIARSS